MNPTLPQGKLAPLHFAVADRQLCNDILREIVPHIPDSEKVLVGCFHGTDISICLDHISVDLWVVGVSELPKDTAMGVIAACQAGDQPCGIIVSTESRAVWQRLIEAHLRKPFAFVISTGAFHSEHPNAFPGARTMKDVHDITAASRQIAEFIWEQVIRVREAREAALAAA